MKSLKEEKSITQVSKDYLLGIQKQPDNTCPLINALQFGSHDSTRRYSVEIDEDPSDLVVESSMLVEAINTLELWSTNLIDLYNDLEEDILNQIDIDYKNDIENTIKTIEHHLSKNRNDKIESFERDINKLISNWESESESYHELEQDLKDQQLNINILEREINYIHREDEEIEEIKRDIDAQKEKYDDMEKELENKISNFKYNIERDFENEVFLFSTFLESIRTNNDQMRQQSYYLRQLIYPYYAELNNLKQPMDYLKEKELGTDQEISIGIIHSNDHPYHFQRVLEYLSSHHIINPLQQKILTLSQRKEDLFNLLTLNGYSTIRYYESREDYINNPDDYKVFKQNKLIDVLEYNPKKNKLSI